MPRTRAVHADAFPYDVYIGRAGRGESGYFGNGYPLSKYTRTESLRLFEADFLERVCSDSEFRRRVLALKGRTLGCHCHRAGHDTWTYRAKMSGKGKPYFCHGDIISEFVEYGWLEGNWWLSTSEMTFEAVFEMIAGDLRVVEVANIARWSRGGPPGKLISWMMKQGRFMFERLS